MYSQLFNLLCDRADDVHHGRLPYHVRILADEFANIGQIPKFDKLIATIRSREISASIILQSKSQLKTIYKDAAETILGNCDTMLFLGGKESSTLKEISETLGKETIDLYNTSDTRGQSRSYGMNYQKTGKELMSRDELAVMDGSKCILQLRGVRPFFSDKFDITKHKRYKELSDYDKKNEFDVEAYMRHPVGRTQDKADDKKFDEKSAQFWEKVLEIEEKLNLKFIPPKDDIEFETICLVEQLYQNLICKKPVKQREIITSIISDMNVKEGVNLDDLIGKQIFFQYNATTTFELFEKEFSLPAILGIFNSTFKSYEILDDNKTKIILGIKDKNQKPFTAILCFASDSDLNEYVKENPDCYENILSNAKFPQDYLE